jgi:transmembrane sensor
MKEDFSSPSEEREMDLAAASWLARRNRGLSPDEQDEFFDWLAEHPMHIKWYQRHLDTWQRMEALAQWKPEHSERANPDLLRNRHFRLRPSHWAAVAATLVLSLLFWKMLPEVADLNAPDPQKYVARSYESHVLPDGSKVDMKDGAAMTVIYTERERRIELVSSEVHFEVQKQPHAPFVVHAKGYVITAIGTAFSVAIREDRVELLVTEGHVEMVLAEAEAAGPLGVTGQPVVAQVKAGQRSVGMLQRGEQGIVVSDVSPQELDDRLHWKPRSLNFNRVTLQEVITEFNRRNVMQLEILDAELEELVVVASFHSANVDKLVSLLEATMGIEAVLVTNGTIGLRRSKSAMGATFHGFGSGELE